jgi:uncharacterized membrane protein
MKEELMVVGINAVNDDIMKLELVPLTQLKQKNNIIDTVLSGNTQEIMKAVQAEQQHRHIIFVTQEWCMRKQIIPFCSVTLEFDTSDDHKQKTDTL